MNKISVENLNVCFNDKVVFNNFNFYAEKNEIVGLYAPSGAGKTTLLNYISENYESVSYSYQDLRLLENISVLNNLIIPLSNYMSKEKAKETAFSILNKLKIQDKADQKICSLSGGEKQLISLARALIFKSDILLLDECFNSLDDNKRKLALEVTKEELKRNPRIAVIVSHNKEDLDFLCTRICLLEN